MESETGRTVARPHYRSAISIGDGWCRDEACLARLSGRDKSRPYNGPYLFVMRSRFGLTRW